MERREFEEKWKESYSHMGRSIKVYIGKKGGYVIADDYKVNDDIVSFLINGTLESDIEFGRFTFEEILDVNEYEVVE
jgi:hypothetical protein